MKYSLLVGLSIMCVALVPSMSAWAQSGANVGVLSCTVEGGLGLILGSSKEMVCNFDPTDGSEPHHYVGSVGKLGLDIGITNDSYITWQVIASGNLSPGSLAGGR